MEKIYLLCNRDSRGIETYTQNYGKDLPFMLLAFNNTSSNYFQINVETKARGTKSFCIYCDTDASEDDIKVTKQLPPNSSRAIVIMKHTNSSLFSISYSVQASSASAMKIIILITIIIDHKAIMKMMMMLGMILFSERKEKLLMKMDILCNISGKKKMGLLLVLKIKEELGRDLNLF